jgi:hypothetical protein
MELQQLKYFCEVAKTLESAIVRVGQNDMGDRYEEMGFIRMTSYACLFWF